MDFIHTDVAHLARKRTVRASPAHRVRDNAAYADRVSPFVSTAALRSRIRPAESA